MSRRLAVLAGFAAALAAPAVARAQAYNFQVDASPIDVAELGLTPSTAYTFSTSSLGAGQDTVLRVLRKVGSGVYSEVAWNDDEKPGMRSSLIRYTTPASGGMTFLVVTHAKEGTPYGLARMRVVDAAGNVRHDDFVPAGGTAVAVPPSSAATPNSYETALAPGGSADTLVLALSNTRALIGFDDDGGVGLASRTAPLGVRTVIVGSANGNRGAAFLRVNDRLISDLDADGLGARLEAALGSCDSATTSLFCNTVFNRKDSDRDGLEDQAEVFGVDSSPPQYLPRWGANPAHKDVFVEIDFKDPYFLGGFTEAHAESARDFYAPAPADHVDNPDGLPGISLHIDSGGAPANPANVALVGNWGGAQQIAATETDLLQYLTPARRGLFHHGLAAGGGQAAAPGDWLGFSLYNWCSGMCAVQTFAHELGHNLNLVHEGPYQAQNCSPIYPSNMNYAAGAYPDLHFSDGSKYPGIVLNGSSLCEADGLGAGADLSHLAGFGIPVPMFGGDVDWNRDGDISDCAHPVQAVINWYPGSGCGAHVQGDQTLGVGRSPSLARMGNWLYAFFLDTDLNRVVYRRSRLDLAVGHEANRGCPFGITGGPAAHCSDWEPAVIVATSMPAVGSVHALSLDGKIYVVYSSTLLAATHGMSFATSQNATTGVLNFATPISAPGASRLAPELQLTNVMVGTTLRRRVLMAWNDVTTLRLRTATFDPAAAIPAFSAAADAADPAGAVIATGGGAPSAVFWGTAATASSSNEVWLIVPDASSLLTLYRYVPATDRWENRTATVFPIRPSWTVIDRVGFAFRPLTDGDGRVIDPLRGEMSLAYGDNAGVGSLWLSTIVTATRPPSTTLRFDYSNAGRFGHPWYSFANTNGGADYFTDPQVPWLKAAMVDTSGNVHFLPMADGIYDLDFRDGSDWQVAERGTCLAIRNGDTAFCGTVNRFGF